MKFFRINVIARICLSVFFGLIGWYAYFETPFWLVSFWMLVFFILSIAETIRYVERSERDVSNFLLAIKQNDFTNHYPSGNRANHLQSAFNLITSSFIKLRNEKESNFHFLQTIVEHSGVPLLAYHVQNEEISLVNKSMKDLLGLPHLTKLSSLGHVDHKIVETIRALGNDEKVLLKIQLKNDFAHLSITGKEMVVDGDLNKVISMHNIDAELDQKEVESWQKLIRVMTHEIKNSVIPISTLTEVINDMIDVESDQSSLEHLTKDDQEDLIISLRTIEKRSKGLVKFVTSYGDLAKVPKPQFQLTDLNELIEDVVHLQEKTIQKTGVTVELDLPNPPIVISLDCEMIEQVLINLIKNASEAIEDSDSEKQIINLRLTKSASEVILTVSDTGSGIEQDILDQMFTPFFTTKSEGSGIGLSYGKQVMRAHKGNLRAHSVLGEGSTFEMIFWNI